MEQFFIILAVIIFMLFRGAGFRSRQGDSGENPRDILMGSQPGSRDPSRELRERTSEANLRALEALQRWEAKQRGGEPVSPEPAPRTSPTRREPLPRAPRERSHRVSFARRAAERERKEAYADIASMLDPSRVKMFKPRPHSEVGLDAQASDRETASARATSSPSAPEHGSRSSRSEERSARPHVRKRGPAAALARIEKLPLGARAIVYGEILGRPKGGG